MFKGEHMDTKIINPCALVPLYCAKSNRNNLNVNTKATFHIIVKQLYI